MCMARNPVVEPAEGSAAQPRSIVPPQWAKSTTTTTPLLVEQSPTGWAPAGAPVTTREAPVPAAPVPAAAITTTNPASHLRARPPAPRWGDRRDWAIPARFPNADGGVTRC